MIIVGHNYPAHFGNLKMLSEGDAVVEVYERIFHRAFSGYKSI